MSAENKTAAKASGLPDEVLADLQSLISDMHEGPGSPASAEILLDLTGEVPGSPDDGEAPGTQHVDALGGVSDRAGDGEVDVADDGVPYRGAEAEKSTAALADSVDLAAHANDVPFDARWGESRAASGRHVPSASSIRRARTRISRWLAMNWAYVVAGILVLMGMLLLVAGIAS